MRIGQSAAKPRTAEGSETIPLGSRLSINIRSGRHPFSRDEDIVHALLKDKECSYYTYDIKWFD